jgi:hypothetical protein
VNLKKIKSLSKSKNYEPVTRRFWFMKRTMADYLCPVGTPRPKNSSLLKSGDFAWLIRPTITLKKSNESQLKTLGCRLNEAELETWAQAFNFPDTK